MLRINTFKESTESFDGSSSNFETFVFESLLENGEKLIFIHGIFILAVGEKDAHDLKTTLDQSSVAGIKEAPDVLHEVIPFLTFGRTLLLDFVLEGFDGGTNFTDKIGKKRKIFGVCFGGQRGEKELLHVLLILRS